MRCYTHNKTRILMQIEKHMRVHQAFSSRYVCYLALSERMNKKNSNRRTYSSLKTELTSAAPKHVWLNCSINHNQHVLYHVKLLLLTMSSILHCCLEISIQSAWMLLPVPRVPHHHHHVFAKLIFHMAGFIDGFL